MPRYQFVEEDNTVVDANGRMVASGIGGNSKQSMSAMLSLVGLLNLAASSEQRQAALKAQYVEIQALVGTSVSTLDPRLNGLRALTTTASPGTASYSTAVSLDTTSAATLCESVKYQFERIAKILDAYTDRIEDCFDLLSVFLKFISNKELWAALGVNVDDTTMILLSTLGGGSQLGVTATVPALNS